jgi:DNA-binding response OmpR family regulator
MKRILIVDDHADIRKLIRMTLEFEDYEVFEAGDAVSAVSIAADLRPDLVVLDVMMPGEFDGLEACRRLKSPSKEAAPQVMLLSARGQASDREAGRNAGADAYLVKPFSPLQLIDSISAMWAQA